MTDIFLLHRPGVDRKVLQRFLKDRGHRVHAHDDLEIFRQAIQEHRPAENRVAVIQESSAAPGADYAFLSGCPSLVMGSGHLAPRGAARELVPDPCFLDDLEASVERLAAGSEPPDAAPAQGTPAPPRTSPRSLLLRGVAHALNNPLSAALGWLQLLSTSHDQRYLEKVTKELGRIEQITHALSLLGRGSSGLSYPFDLARLLERRTAPLAEEGLVTEMSVPASPLPLLPGDQAEWELMWDLLLGSFHEDRARVEKLALALEVTRDLMLVRVDATGVRLPEDADAARLEDLLMKKIRHSRALGLALAQLLVVDQARGALELEHTAAPGMRIKMTLPLATGPSEEGS